MIRKEKERSFYESEEYLGFNIAELTQAGAVFTAKEISTQPELWVETWTYVKKQRAALENFLAESYAHADLDVILTGAGTSAFIGDILVGLFKKNSGKRTRAIATTDLVTHPNIYFHSDIPTLLVSFARSGNSPESVAAVNLADKICGTVYHLIITCNAEGELAMTNSYNRAMVFLLPPQANDQSLAMTGSFSSMLLTGLLISKLRLVDELGSQIELLSGYGTNVIDNYAAKLQKVAARDFKRAVFLGSGPLDGSAKESGLKLQELTDGKVICKNDSFLGFRHGPKAVIDRDTLLVYLFSSSGYVHQYELDLINDINEGEKGLYRIAIIETAGQTADLDVDLLIEFSDGDEKLDEDFLTVCSVLPAQILGFYKCLNLNLKPDSPSLNNTITRVVQGVNIYPFDPQEGAGMTLAADSKVTL